MFPWSIRLFDCSWNVCGNLLHEIFRIKYNPNGIFIDYFLCGAPSTCLSSPQPLLWPQSPVYDDGRVLVAFIIYASIWRHGKCLRKTWEDPTLYVANIECCAWVHLRCIAFSVTEALLNLCVRSRMHFMLILYKGHPLKTMLGKLMCCTWIACTTYSVCVTTYDSKTVYIQYLQHLHPPFNATMIKCATLNDKQVLDNSFTFIPHIFYVRFCESPISTCVLTDRMFWHSSARISSTKCAFYPMFTMKQIGNYPYIGSYSK